MSTDSQATYLWRCFNDLELHIRSLGAGAPEPVPTTCNSEPISKETGWTNEAEWTRGAGWRKAVGSHQPLRLQCLAGIDRDVDRSTPKKPKKDMMVSTDQRVDGSIPVHFSQHVEVSSLDTEIFAMVLVLCHQCTNVCEWLHLLV